jgi:UDP-N-acetylmuramate: L-alanyl-gamma-D-glutamyl-meso-diaminopimelate ligase
MHIHFVAVAGTGMGALAGLLAAAGHHVSGSDTSFDPPMGPALEAWGVECHAGFLPEHLAPRPDLVVIGNVCRRDNPLAQAAIQQGIPYTDMAHALADHILHTTSPLVIAGTHGKTTTSAMAACLLVQSGHDAGFLIGGLPKNFPTSFRLPPKSPKVSLTRDLSAKRKPAFVVEGDEYDTAFFEKTPKFWHYQPEVVVLTSIEHDHVDIYPNEEAYLEAFRGLIERVPEHGLIVAAAHDPLVVQLVQKHAKAPVTWFCLAGEEQPGVPPEWCAAPAQTTERGQTFDLFVGGVAAGRYLLPVPGKHNLRNALAALAAVAHGYGVPIRSLQEPLASFQGVRRRQDLLGSPRGILVYDDFAHHPTAVDETLRALRSKHPGANLIAVFEPRSATACRAMHQQAYAKAFGAANRVLLAPIGRNLAPEEALNTQHLASDLRNQGTNATATESISAILEHLVSESQPGDVIALLSNGAFGGLHAKLLAKLAQSPPETQ